MARVEPPMMLSGEELPQRVAYLKLKGLPMTMSNIDPALYNYLRSMDRFIYCQVSTILVAVAVLITFFVFNLFCIFK